MKLNVTRSALSLFLSALLLCPALPAAAESEQALPPHDGYIVGLKEGAAQLLNAEDVTLTGERFVVVDRLEDARSIPDRYIAYIEPNYRVELLDGPQAEPGADQSVPNDQFYGQYQWSLQRIHMPAAYRAGLTGAGVKVGFVDSGIRTTHEDLAGASISGCNLLDETGTIEDDYGHGTFAGGVVLAQTNNGLGLAGVAPGVEFNAYRVFAQKTTSIAAVVRGLDQAVADGCRIIDMSLGARASSPTLRDSVNRALEQGCVLVAAVGNDYNASLNYPAAYNGVIGVGSVDRDLTVSDFSNRNESVDFTAPGNQVVGLDNELDNGYKLAGQRGTSFAAPIVTGLAALALEYDSALDARGVTRLLELSALDLGTEGKDPSYGYGMVDAERLVQALEQAYAIHYETDGGSLPEGSPLTYHIKDGEIPLPIPTLEGHEFAGWYENADFSGTPLSAVPAGAAGELTYYAGWQSEADILPREITVEGFPARLQPDGSYLVRLPYGTDLSAVTKAQVNVIPGPTTQCVEVEAGEEPGTFRISVHTAAPSVTRVFTLNAVCADLHVAQDSTEQTGTAAPGSSDGWIRSVPYEAETSGWFRVKESTVLPEDFALSAVVTEGCGSLTCEGTLLTYVPAQADADRTVVLTVRGSSGGEETLEAVTVRIQVSGSADPLPNPDGSTTQMRWDRETGALTEIRVSLPVDLCHRAEQTGEPIALTMPSLDRETFLLIETGSDRPVRVEIPVKQATPGLAALRYEAGGGEELIRKSLADGDSLRLSVSGSLKLRLTDWSRSFPDTEQHWCADAVRFVTGHDLFAGTSETTFSPDIHLTRAMMVQVLYNMEGRPAVADDHSFRDVEESDWFANAVSWAAKNGVVSGYGNGLFGAEDRVTREQAAVILYNYAGRPGCSSQGPSFADSDRISDFAREAMTWAAENQIINGVGGNQAAPKSFTARAEAAAMIRNFGKAMF